LGYLLDPQGMSGVLGKACQVDGSAFWRQQRRANEPTGFSDFVEKLLGYRA